MTTSIKKLYQHAQKAHGKFNIVVANAGMAESAPAEDISHKLWEKILTVNLTGAFFSVKPALAAMREHKWGRIIFVASTAGLKGYPYVAPYVAAKHGVVGLARALAIETAKAGITVNAVCPGLQRNLAARSGRKPRRLDDKTQRSGSAQNARSQ